jgi:chromosome segregation ATPase
MTPLHIASRLGNAEVVAMLLKRGVNIQMVDEEGRSAQDIAESLKFEDIAQMLARQRQILAVQQERSMTNAMNLIDRIAPLKDTQSSPSSSNVHVDRISGVYDSESEDDSASRVSASQMPTLLADLKAKQKADALSHQAEIDELKAYINLLEKNNHVLDRSLSAANNKLARSGQEVSPIDMYKIDRLNAEINQLSTERDDLLNERARANALEQEVAFLRLKVGADGAELSNSAEELRLARDLDASQKEASAAKAQVVAMKKMMQESVLMEADYKTCQASLTQANKKISSLEADLENAKEAMSSLRKELAEAQHKLKAHNVADLPAKVKLLEAQFEQEKAGHKTTKEQVGFIFLVIFPILMSHSLLLPTKRFSR